MRSFALTRVFPKRDTRKKELVDALNKAIDEKNYEVPRSRWLFKSTYKVCHTPPAFWNEKVRLIIKVLLKNRYCYTICKLSDLVIHTQGLLTLL